MNGSLDTSLHQAKCGLSAAANTAAIVDFDICNNNLTSILTVLCRPGASSTRCEVPALQKELDTAVVVSIFSRHVGYVFPL